MEVLDIRVNPKGNNGEEVAKRTGKKNSLLSSIYMYHMFCTELVRIQFGVLAQQHKSNIS